MLIYSANKLFCLIFWKISVIFNNYVVEEEDKENTSASQPESDSIVMTSSKDTCHILRLSAVLHVLTHYWMEEFHNPENYTSPPTHIPIERVKEAQTLYSIMIQHKATYIQVHYRFAAPTQIN